MEFFDIVDDNGNPTGKTIDRATAHREGYPHRTAHVWIVRRKQGHIEILLQKRCAQKDSFPGCYDISSAGHIPAGVDYVPSALRELKEELGLEIRPEELQECGIKRLKIETQFYGEPFRDHQISKVFLLWRDMEVSEFRLQKEEIDSVMWMDFEACKEAVSKNTYPDCEDFPNCIDLCELQMLEDHLS